MTDQIQALLGLGVKAAMLSSKSPKAEQEAVRRLRSPRAHTDPTLPKTPDLGRHAVWAPEEPPAVQCARPLRPFAARLTSPPTVTPERLSSPPFRKRLVIIHKQKELNRLVIDEAHCISECAFPWPTNGE